MLTEIWTFASPLISGLIGAFVVYLFGIRQLVAQRRIAFVERQLTEFYAPLAGLRRQIRANTELRDKVSVAAESAWQEICASYGDTLMHDHNERYEPFGKIIEYDNKQFSEEMLSRYRQMLSLFTERYHLAAPETREFYEPLLEYVEVWNRWLGQSLPREALKRLDHGEGKLHTFYEHLEQKMNALQKEVAGERDG